MGRNESIRDVLLQLNRDISVIIGFVDGRRHLVASENDTRPCTYFGCMGTQRFTTIVALGDLLQGSVSSLAATRRGSP